MVDLWASASLRTGGDDLAQALGYLGARPVWDTSSNRVTGIELLPLAKLDRPRIDVTLRISGLFRDIFETQIALLDTAIRNVAALEEDDSDNPIACSLRRGDNLARIFGGAPRSSYGAGTAALTLDGNWRARRRPWRSLSLRRDPRLWRRAGGNAGGRWFSRPRGCRQVPCPSARRPRARPARR